MKNNNSMIIIGVSGRTGSGKTYLTDKIINNFDDSIIDKIEVDSYYKDLSHLPMSKRAINNFDHPNAFEFNLLINDINKLKKNNNIKVPIYNYCKHIRSNKTRQIKHVIKILIIEGIFALYNDDILKLLDYKVFLDVSKDICIERRINRDIINRERTKEDIKNQINNTVLPMYNKFIKPTKLYADIIIKKIDEQDNDYVKLMSIINQNIN